MVQHPVVVSLNVCMFEIIHFFVEIDGAILCETGRTNTSGRCNRREHKRDAAESAKKETETVLISCGVISVIVDIPGFFLLLSWLMLCLQL